MFVWKTQLLILFSVFISATAFSFEAESSTANPATVSGQVFESDGVPVAGATIAFFIDDEISTGTSTNADGNFSIQVDPGSYTLRITFVSLRTKALELTLESNEELNLGDIVLEEEAQQLDDVVLETEAAAVETRFDRRIYRGGRDIEAVGGTALDQLETIPSIETDFEGNVSLRGSENVQVLINGRPSALLSGGTDALEAIPADNIERVEVITNPSARYSAQGDAGVINIVLKRNRAVGFNGNVSARTGLPDDHRLSTNLNFVTNNANWFTSFGFRYRDRPSERNRFQRFESADTSFVYTQNQERSRQELRGDLRVGAEVFLGERHTITPSVFLRYRDRNNRSDTFYNDFDLAGNLLRETAREDIEDDSRTNFEFDLAYEFDIGGSDNQKLTADFKFDFQPEQEASDLREFSLTTGEDIAIQRTDNSEQITSFLFNTDYIRGLGNLAEMELGIRSSGRWFDNRYRAEEQRDGETVPLIGFNEDFTYSQNINAAYAILSGQFGRFSVQGGLRLEQTQINTELTESGESNSQNYLNLFPSIFTNYEFNDRNTLQLSYSRRLSRPGFRNLLPFSNLRDSRDIFTGNPNLSPVFTNSYELSYLTLWNSGSVSTSIYHRQSEGVVERISELDNDGVTRRFPINLSTRTSWGTELAVSQRLFSNLRLRGSANYRWSDTSGDFQGQSFQRESTVFFARMRLQWRITRTLNFQTSYFYSGPRSTTQGSRTASYGVNSGMSLDMFDRRATLSISGRDLLNTRGSTRIIDEPNFYSEDRSRWSTQSVRVNFIWRFNSLRS